MKKSDVEKSGREAMSFYADTTSRVRSRVRPKVTGHTKKAVDASEEQESKLL
jgi:hypothetical protein